MLQEERNALRTTLLLRAEQHSKQANIYHDAANYAESIMESGRAQGLMAAVQIVEQWGRAPANENGASA